MNLRIKGFFVDSPDSESYQQMAKRIDANAPQTNAAIFAIEIPWVITVANPSPTWASTWGSSLKSQKIRTSYEMGWLERN
jgi:hypothetical protein